MLTPKKDNTLGQAFSNKEHREQTSLRIVDEREVNVRFFYKMAIVGFLFDCVA
jgi:hypothetical protein